MSAHHSLVHMVVSSVSAADLRHTLCDRCLPKKNTTSNGCRTADTANEKSFSWLNERSNVLLVPSGSHYFSKPLFLHSIKAFYLLIKSLAWGITTQTQASLLRGWGLLTQTSPEWVPVYKAQSCHMQNMNIKASIKTWLTVSYDRKSLFQTCTESQQKKALIAKRQHVFPSCRSVYSFKFKKTGEEFNCIPLTSNKGGLENPFWCFWILLLTLYSFGCETWFI